MCCIVSVYLLTLALALSCRNGCHHGEYGDTRRRRTWRLSSLCTQDHLQGPTPLRYCLDLPGMCAGLSFRDFGALYWSFCICYMANAENLKGVGRFPIPLHFVRRWFFPSVQHSWAVTEAPWSTPCNWNALCPFPVSPGRFLLFFRTHI